jgi:hypothetical protein
VDAAGAVDTAGVVVDAVGVVVDATGVVVESACVVVEPTGVDVSSQPTQAISIALIRMMDLSRCMLPLCSLLSWNDALEVLGSRSECASDERSGLAAKRCFHSRGMRSATCDDYVLGTRLSAVGARSPKHRDKAATLFHGLADRRVVVAGIVPNSMQVSQIGDAASGCFDHAHLPSLGSEVGSAKLLPEVHSSCNRAGATLTVYRRSGRDLD